MLYLKADTITEVVIGPAVAVGDGFVPITSLVGASADEFEIIKHGATTTTTIAGTLAAVTGADGYYALDLSATDTNTEGRLVLLINDDSLILPIRHEFMVVNANVYDSLFAAAGTDDLDVQVSAIDASAITATSIASNALTAAKFNADCITSAKIADGAFVAANFAAASLNGKGDWNVGKTGYALTTADWNVGKTGYSLTVAPLTAVQVNAEVDTALADISLDHLMSSALPTSWAVDIIAGSALDQIADDGTAVYDRTTDSQQAIADSGGGGPTAAQIADAVWDELKSGHTVPDSFGDYLDDEITSRLVSGNVTVGTLAANVITAASIAAAAMNGKGNWNVGKTGYALTTADWNVGKTGYALSAAGVDAVWDELMVGHTTPDSAGLVINEWQDGGRLDALLDLIPTTAMRGTDGVDTATMRGTDGANTTTPQTLAAIVNGILDEDMTGHQTLGTLGQAIGDPVANTKTLYAALVTDAVGASVTADVATVQADTDNIQTRLPATLVTGKMDSDVGNIQANAIDAASIAASALNGKGDWNIGKTGYSISGALTTLDALENVSAATVLTQINTALDTTIAELGVAAPATTPTIRTGLMMLYMMARNKSDVQTSGTDALEYHNNAGGMVFRKLLTDAGGDYSEALMVAGV